ncbi:SOS response-associated peptidase family protein [Cellvibrio sp. NN19]|uniref:SOS response-associated peptidase family protein n=1 Tax=Cellvibrio chitinivorans TaxID=3102792 RepID=UPI002B4051D6|nr:SOS response-associated peptidase family protein [Cellvibrio sp. NN19]
MCGYLRRHVTPRDLRAFLDLLGVKSNDIDWGENEPEYDIPKLEHFYPAWGGNTSRTIKRLLVEEQGELKLVDATWWYHAQEVDGQVVLGSKKTFNARNLHYAFWSNAINHRRAIAIVTGVGEGKNVNGKDVHYLIESDDFLLLGAVYQRFPSGQYTCSIITRDSDPQYQLYHENSFPLFLPNDVETLKLWLGTATADHPKIKEMLDNPKVVNDLAITPVKTFKDAVPTGPTEYLKAE